VTAPAQKQSVETALAVLTETVRNMDKKLDDLAHSKADKTEVTGLTKRIDKIEGHLSKIVWVVLTAVVIAVLGGGYLAKSIEKPAPVPYHAPPAR